MSTDIFPEINIPVISIVWTYAGLSAQEMGQRITAVTERSLTTTVNDIEHIESQSLYGLSVTKVFFQPNANIPTAIAQIVATEQQQLRQLPPGHPAAAGHQILGLRAFRSFNSGSPARR